MITWDDGKKLLENKTSKRLDKETTLVLIDKKTLGIQLNDTVVVYVFSNGIYQYNSGEWRNRKTINRMNKYGPVKVLCKDDVWYVGDYYYTDGVRFNSTGKILTKLRKIHEIVVAEKSVDKAIKKYINDFGKEVLEFGLVKFHPKFPHGSEWQLVQLTTEKPLEPLPLDCWPCYFATKETPDPLGVKHLIQHFNDSYFVPSLLWNAIKEQDFGNHGFVWDSINRQANEGDTRTLNYVLKQYFEKRKQALYDLVR